MVIQLFIIEIYIYIYMTECHVAAQLLKNSSLIFWSASLAILFDIRPKVQPYYINRSSIKSKLWRGYWKIETLNLASAAMVATTMTRVFKLSSGANDLSLPMNFSASLRNCLRFQQLQNEKILETHLD